MKQEVLITSIKNENTLNSENKIFIISADINVRGYSLDVPESSLLQFKGGSLYNGSLSIYSNSIICENYQCFGDDLKVKINGLANVNPYWFGLGGDAGKNTLALRRCLASASNNIRINIPTGNFPIDATDFTIPLYPEENLNYPVIEFIGQGQTNSVFTLIEGDAKFMFNFGAIQCSSIRDVGFYGKAENWGEPLTNDPNPRLDALVLLSGYSNKIQRCFFKGSSNDCLKVIWANHQIIENCSFWASYRYGIVMERCLGGKISGNWCELIKAGIHIKRLTPNTEYFESRVLIESGFYENVESHIVISGTGGNMIHLNQGYDVNGNDLVIRPARYKYAKIDSDFYVQGWDRGYYVNGIAYKDTLNSAGSTVYVYEDEPMPKIISDNKEITPEWISAEGYANDTNIIIEKNNPKIVLSAYSGITYGFNNTVETFNEYLFCNQNPYACPKEYAKLKTSNEIQNPVIHDSRISIGLGGDQRPTYSLQSFTMDITYYAYIIFKGIISLSSNVFTTTDGFEEYWMDWIGGILSTKSKNTGDLTLRGINEISVAELEFKIDDSIFERFSNRQAYLKLRPVNGEIYYATFSNIKYPRLDYPGLYENNVAI